MEKPKKPTKAPLKDEQTENSAAFLARAKQMLGASVGRLPTALVTIILVSLAMGAVTGLMMQLNKSGSRVHEFMPQRLKASDDAAEIDDRKLQGNWVYQTADYAMTLTFIGDRFEWIMLFKDVPEAQFFARGNYRVVGDVMILGIRPDLGLPRDPAKPWMKYMPISMRDLNTKLSVQNNKIIWDIPSSEQNKIISQSGRIFMGHEDGHFEWKNHRCRNYPKSKQ